MKTKKFFVFIAIIILIIVVDQISKIYVAQNFYLGESVTVIDGFFNFTYVRNPGAAFGFGGTFKNWLRYTLFLGLPVIACGWIFSMFVKSLTDKLILTWAYALILGGAVGNLIDRFRLDYVIDFFDFYIKTSHFATFNVADTSISVAAGLIIIDYIKQGSKKEAIAESVEEIL